MKVLQEINLKLNSMTSPSLLLPDGGNDVLMGDEVIQSIWSVLFHPGQVGGFFIRHFKLIYLQKSEIDL